MDAPRTAALRTTSWSLRRRADASQDMAREPAFGGGSACSFAPNFMGHAQVVSDHKGVRVAGPLREHRNSGGYSLVSDA